MDGLEVQDSELVAYGVGGSINGDFCKELKCCLLKFAITGVDMVFLDRKFLRTRSLFNGSSQCASPPAQYPSSSSSCVRRRSYGSKDCHTQAESLQIDCLKNSDNDEVGHKHDSYLHTRRWKYEDIPQDANFPSGGYISGLALDALTFFAVMLMKFMSFQFNLLVSFFTFPIWLSYVSFMFLMFPFQTLGHIKGYFIKKLLRMCYRSSRKITQKAKKFGFAVFWSSCVCLMLLGLLVTSFLLGGLMMNHIIEKPFQTTETLSFDYTKASPEALS